MNYWQIHYWSTSTGKSPLQKWFDQLTNEQLKSVAKEMKILEKLGNQLKLPHSRALGDGLFELRERRYGYRIYYALHGDLIIVLLAAGDKKSQEHDIKTARKRLAELRKDNQ